MPKKMMTSPAQTLATEAIRLERLGELRLVAVAKRAKAPMANVVSRTETIQKMRIAGCRTAPGRWSSSTKSANMRARKIAAQFVLAGRDLAIHALGVETKTWIRGTSPRKTTSVDRRSAISLNQRQERRPA